MGFQQHPGVLEVEARFPTAAVARAGRKYLVQILYHADPGTLFRSAADLPGLPPPPGPPSHGWQPQPVAVGSLFLRLWC
eukprot:3051238-Alexandrium_andersonii.AAC.1